MRLWVKLWKDETGVVVSTELALVATLVGLGLLVGLATLRDGANNEMADVAQAIDDLDQSFFISEIRGHSAASARTFWFDVDDFCDDGSTTTRHCISITVPPAIPDGPDDD